jgi:hypothetical protein
MDREAGSKLLWSDELVWLPLVRILRMASAVNSNFVQNLNRVPSCFWFQTLLELLLCNLFLGVVKRCMMV